LEHTHKMGSKSYYPLMLSPNNSLVLASISTAIDMVKC
jgi:hypothetical protein